MGILNDLTGSGSNTVDDVVARYNELRRLEVAGKLGTASRQELQNLRHLMHLDD